MHLFRRKEDSRERRNDREGRDSLISYSWRRRRLPSTDGDAGGTDGVGSGVIGAGGAGRGGGGSDGGGGGTGGGRRRRVLFDVPVGEDRDGVVFVVE